MQRGLKWQFWLESVVAIITGVMFVVTLFWNDWIEIVFRVDPDGNNGSTEKAIVGALFLVTIALIVAAVFEWRKARASIS